jgi:hypothetical protein
MHYNVQAYNHIFYAAKRFSTTKEYITSWVGLLEGTVRTFIPQTVIDTRQMIGKSLRHRPCDVLNELSHCHKRICVCPLISIFTT